jgi:hypothetical protein
MVAMAVFVLSQVPPVVLLCRFEVVPMHIVVVPVMAAGALFTVSTFVTRHPAPVE